MQCKQTFTAGNLAKGKPETISERTIFPSWTVIEAP